jgi:hypothetical protein
MRTFSMWVLRAAPFAIIPAVVSMSPIIYAQDSGESIKFNVPFAFEDGVQHYPPGQYTVHIRMENQNLLLIRGLRVLAFCWRCPMRIASLRRPPSLYSCSTAIGIFSESSG